MQGNKIVRWEDCEDYSHFYLSTNVILKLTEGGGDRKMEGNIR